MNAPFSSRSGSAHPLPTNCLHLYGAVITPCAEPIDNVTLCCSTRIVDGGASRQGGCRRGRKRTASAPPLQRRARRREDQRIAIAPHKNVDGFRTISVPAFEQHRARSHTQQALCLFDHGRDIVSRRFIQQRRCFGNVWSEQRRPW